ARRSRRADALSQTGAGDPGSIVAAVRLQPAESATKRVRAAVLAPTGASAADAPGLPVRVARLRGADAGPAAARLIAGRVVAGLRRARRAGRRRRRRAGAAAADAPAISLRIASLSGSRAPRSAATRFVAGGILAALRRPRRATDGRRRPWA